jgi:5-formyltetrahydrofolate cyclo-ligase
VRCAGARRHDADAGGDAALLEAKAQLRAEVWRALGDTRVALSVGNRAGTLERE